MNLRKSNSGFTLIELTIVVTSIAILATIAIPKFANAMQKSQEGSVKGNLGSLRSAIAIYYAENEGLYPADMTALAANAKYIAAIPYAKGVYIHTATAMVTTQTSPNDAGGWSYNGTAGDAK